MAEPISTTLLLAKMALTAASDKKVRNGIGWIIAAICSPIIVVVALICGMLSGTSNHNNSALELAFHGGAISASVPSEYRVHIESMRDSFQVIDGIIVLENMQIEDGESLDTIRIKAIFYALFFAADAPSLLDHIKYVNCFSTKEERIRTVKSTDELGNTIEIEESYIVVIPIKDMSVVYGNIEKAMGIVVTQDNMANVEEIYYRIKNGVAPPTYGDGFEDFIDELPTTDAPFVGMDGFVEPVSNWRSIVSSEFGYRIHPVTGKGKGHSGIDIAKVKGTPIYSVLDGTVILVRYADTGYGYHVLVDHGGGVVTMYAHCSKLLVQTGQQVKAGEKIAEVGTTGLSTGNHLHFEIRLDGEKQNPRSYLP